MTLQRRLMLAFAAFTLVAAALFGLFAMAFTYVVEDGFIEQLLHREATRLRAQHARDGRWPAPVNTPMPMQVHEQAATLPAEVAAALASEPQRREITGAEGRHYHLLPLVREGQPPWLLAEVSSQLIVRPMRGELLQWLAGWGLAVVGLAGLLGGWLARRVSRPLARLSEHMRAARPQDLPRLPGGEPSDEIGDMTRSLDALLERTRDFIAREQAFSRDASHELRTPLAVLRIGLDRLHAEGDETRRRELLPLQTAVRLMEQTVATLLMLAREPTTAPVAPTPILPLVEDWVLAHAAALDARALRIACQLGPADALPLPAPVLQLVLASLLANALTHGQAGGCITISWQGGSLSLRNPGAGDAGAGSGLGLGIVQRLLAQHGGTLVFEQAGGQTEVRIELDRP
jgi:signal transduction histidine kinase